MLDVTTAGWLMDQESQFRMVFSTACGVCPGVTKSDNAPGHLNSTRRPFSYAVNYQFRVPLDAGKRHVGTARVLSEVWCGGKDSPGWVDATLGIADRGDKRWVARFGLQQHWYPTLR